MDIRVVFMGSPEFALPPLQALANHFQVLGVVTQPDRPSGRGRTVAPPPVKVLAKTLNLPLIQPPHLRDPQTIQKLRDLKPDVIVVAAFGQILRPEVLSLPPYGCINVHASLLPRWRGAAPVQAAILHGDQQTGVTIIKMDAGIDTGPILSQRAVSVSPQDTAGSLAIRLAHLGAELLIETLPKYLSDEIHPQTQDENGATYAPMLKKGDGQLEFTLPAQELARRVRAFNPWPGTFMHWKNQLIKIHQAHAVDANKLTMDRHLDPGTTIIHADLPAVVAVGGILVLDEVQPECKKPMAGADFLHGARAWGK
jgi:methionyl-tRNA formyltransferase